MNYYNKIKEELINNEITKKVKDYSKNKSDLTTYYHVGKLLVKAGKHYRKGIVKEYSRELTKELGKGYTFTSLTRMKKFYLFTEKLATVSQQFTYGYYVELLSLSDMYEIKYYIMISEQHNLSIRKLRFKIKNQEYQRLDENTKCKLTSSNETNHVIDFIKNLILIKNSRNYNQISEKILQN